MLCWVIFSRKRCSSLHDEFSSKISGPKICQCIPKAFSPVSRLVP
jgi:hypothetical protein